MSLLKPLLVFMLAALAAATAVACDSAATESGTNACVEV